MTAASVRYRPDVPAARRSGEAKSMVEQLLALPPDTRRPLMRELPDRDLAVLLAASDRTLGSAYALYTDDPVGFVEDILGETIWSKQREVLAALVTHKQVAVPAGFGLGKCVHWQEMIPLADGRLVQAKDLVGTEFEVVAWQEDGTQVRRRARAAWNAVEATYRIHTVSGREAVRNADHPFWHAKAVSAVKGGRAKGTVTLTPTGAGWTPLGKIAAGDLVLVPEAHSAEGTKPVDPDHAVLAGYLLGDGGTTTSHITFTQMEGPALEEFRAVVDRMDAEIVSMNRPHHYRVRMKKQHHGWNADGIRVRTSPFVELVRDWGLRGKTARQKSFPDWVWTLPNDQLAVVLGRLFACDAWVYYGERAGGNGVNAQVAIALASERMIRDVETAMLRLGIWGNVRARTVTLDSKKFQAWEWSCRDREALTRMAQVIDMPGKNEKLQAMVEALATRSAARMTRWPRRNAPAGYRWDKVTEVEELPAAPTVAIEVDQDHTFVTTFVEHNTFLGARAVIWMSVCNPVGTALTVTTATRLRQVQRQLWPHIRKVVGRAGLPGVVDAIQYKMPDRNGVDTTVAYGFTAPEGDEAAMQGIHSAKLLLVVDEAGGIPPIVGKSTRNLLTGDATMLAIGNPPTDSEGGWFEGLARAGEDPERPEIITIAIPATSSPAITGEDAGRCQDCPPNVAAHPLATHLVDQDWIDDAIRDFGPDAPYVAAKVHAKFPQGTGLRIIPVSWLEAALDNPEPDDEDFLALCELGLHDERAKYKAERGAWIRLGVDVAADGGDELVIARAVGDLYTIEHVSSGSVNANAVDVAGKVLREIRRCQALRAELGSPGRIRVKVDGIGVGWGVSSTLTAWGEEGLHDADIVRVNVAEDTARIADGASMVPYRKRDEMWLSGRALVQPLEDTGRPRVRLRVDRRTIAQLAAPTYNTTSDGRTRIESKKSMRSRGVSSPDRAEALLLCAYEPVVRRRARLIA